MQLETPFPPEFDSVEPIVHATIEHIDSTFDFLDFEICENAPNDDRLITIDIFTNSKLASSISFFYDTLIHNSWIM